MKTSKVARDNLRYELLPYGVDDALDDCDALEDKLHELLRNYEYLNPPGTLVVKEVDELWKSVRELLYQGKFVEWERGKEICAALRLFVEKGHHALLKPVLYRLRRLKYVEFTHRGWNLTRDGRELLERE